MERLLDRQRELPRVANLEAVFHDGARDTHHVRFLKRVLANQMALDLSRKHHHRDRVHVCGGDARNRVRGAGSRGHQHHAGLARRPCVPIRRVRRGLLVAHEHVGDFSGFEKGVVDVKNCAARVAKDEFDALVLEGPGDHLASGEEFHALVQFDFCIHDLHSGLRPRLPSQTANCIRRLAVRGQAPTADTLAGPQVIRKQWHSR